jgi:hypothetical protein
MEEMDKKALNRWEKSNISYTNYSKYISTKTDKFKLTIIDLLYVSNFKGGNATINEIDETITKKLFTYGQIFKEINGRFNDRNLNSLDNNETIELIEFSDKLIELTNYKSEFKIDGFSVSFLTALLHFYFPNLYPILDRRVLNGLKLISKNDLDKQGQVKNLKDYYKKLILDFKRMQGNQSIRELDKILFIAKF